MTKSKNQSVVAVESAPVVEAATVTKRSHTTRTQFLTAYIKHKGNVKAAAAELGMSPNSFTVRKSNLKADGVVFPQFPRTGGGGGKADLDVAGCNALIASLMEPAVDADVAEATEQAEVAEPVTA